jgi:hypothetical protein
MRAGSSGRGKWSNGLDMWSEVAISAKGKTTADKGGETTAKAGGIEGRCRPGRCPAGRRRMPSLRHAPGPGTPRTLTHRGQSNGARASLTGRTQRTETAEGGSGRHSVDLARASGPTHARGRVRGTCRSASVLVAAAHARHRARAAPRTRGQQDGRANGGCSSLMTERLRGIIGRSVG